MKSELGTITGHNAGLRVCNALFNHFRVKAYLISINAKDTVFEYNIMTDEKLTPKRERELAAFVFGMKVAFNGLDFI